MQRASRFVFVALILALDVRSPAAETPATQPVAGLTFESVTLEKGGPPATVHLLRAPAPLTRRPAILMPGALRRDEPPDWAAGLLAEGYMLVAFSVAYPPDPDPERWPVWLYFDQRFAHGYAQMGERAPRDAARVIEYLIARGEVDRDKIGWLGSSSTGIPGLAVATQGPRLAAVVAFVSTGAYTQWFETWHTNRLWRGKTPDLWPETRELLKKYDPILHVAKMYPTAVLMVSGGNDLIVDPKTARAFMDAARPYYENDPERLRLVVYEGFGHNLPRDVIRLYAEHWFRLYMHPSQPPPVAPAPPPSLTESASRTQINASDHRDVTGAK